MLPSSCLDGSVTPVGPGQNPQYTGPVQRREAVGCSQGTQDEPTKNNSSSHPKREKPPNAWTMPTEIYKLLFRHVSDIGHFITNLASCMITSSALPQVMCDASVLGIDKPGGKGVRVLCLLDAFGKTLSKLALDFVTDRPSTHPYGFAKKKNRDRRVCMSAVTLRMRQL